MDFGLRGKIAIVLGACQGMGRAAARSLGLEGCDLALATHQLVVLIDGLSAERVLYPDRVTPQRQARILEELLQSFAAQAAPLRIAGDAAS